MASPDEAKQQEQELMTEDGFFKQRMRNGTAMVRQDRGKKSAYEIVMRLVQTSRSGAFNIQEEMVDRHKRLDETAAGQVVEAELLKSRKKHETELKALRDEMQEALEQKDYALAEEIEIVKADVEQRSQQEQEASKRLQSSHNDLIRRMQDQHMNEQRRLEDMMNNQRREHDLVTQNLRKANETNLQLERERWNREERVTRTENSYVSGKCLACGAFNQDKDLVKGHEYCGQCWNCQHFIWLS